MLYRCVHTALLITVAFAFVVSPGLAQKGAKSRSIDFGSRALKLGDKGSDVSMLQSLLVEIGYQGAINGKFGRGTVSQVNSWKKNEMRRQNAVISIQDAHAILKVAHNRHAAVKSSLNLTSGGSLPPMPIAPAILTADTMVVAPPIGAPKEVTNVINAGNRIASLPYRYGGGHRSFEDSGYDCSGSVSYALKGANLVKGPLDSTGFMSWGNPGPGRWITVYTHPGHAYMVVGGVRFDTSAGRSVDSTLGRRIGNRWTTQPRSDAGYVARHPAGL